MEKLSWSLRRLHPYTNAEGRAWMFNKIGKRPEIILSLSERNGPEKVNACFLPDSLWFHYLSTQMSSLEIIFSVFISYPLNLETRFLKPFSFLFNQNLGVYNVMSFLSCMVVSQIRFHEIRQWNPKKVLQVLLKVSLIHLMQNRLNLPNEPT